MGKRYLSFQPLEDYVHILHVENYYAAEEPLSDELFAEMCGVSLQSIARWRESGRLQWGQADQVACNLGSHALIIWDDEWSELDADWIHLDPSKKKDKLRLNLIERSLRRVGAVMGLSS